MIITKLDGEIIYYSPFRIGTHDQAHWNSWGGVFVDVSGYLLTGCFFDVQQFVCVSKYFCSLQNFFLFLSYLYYF